MKPKRKKLSSQMRGTITVLLAYFWAYFPIWIGIVTWITMKLVEALEILQPWDGYIVLGVHSLHTLILGIYHLLGALLEFRSAHCMLQVLHRWQTPKPMDKSWSKTEKTELIISGILFTVIGIALLAMPIIDIINVK